MTKEIPKPNVKYPNPFMQTLDDEQVALLEKEMREHPRPGIDTIQKMLRYIVVPEWVRVVREKDVSPP